MSTPQTLILPAEFKSTTLAGLLLQARQHIRPGQAAQIDGRAVTFVDGMAVQFLLACQQHCGPDGQLCLQTSDTLLDALRDFGALEWFPGIQPASAA